MEHEVKLTHLRPVAGAADRAHNIVVDDNLAILGQVVGFFCRHIAVVHFFPLGLFTQHVGIGGAELFLVKGIAKLLAALGHLFLDLLLDLAQEILDEDIGPVALLGVLVVDKRVVEGTHVAGSLPNAGVHEDGGVNAHDILVQTGHGLPPIVLDVVFELHAHLAIIINGSQTIVDFAGGENESVLLAVGYQHLKKFILCHYNDIFTNLRKNFRKRRADLRFGNFQQRLFHEVTLANKRVGNCKLLCMNSFRAITQQVDVDDAEYRDMLREGRLL